MRVFGDWWFGLAVSLDRQGYLADAQATYRRALRASNLTTALRAYAEQRVKAIKVVRVEVV